MMLSVQSKQLVCKNIVLIKSTGTSVCQNVHMSPIQKLPQALPLKLPCNIIDINASEVGRFSPLRERDISGPVINSHFPKEWNKIDITTQADPHVNKYDCQGAVSLASSMQSNVPSPFSGNHTHLGMPGSQWGQGYKFLSGYLHGSHYLTLRNEYRGLHNMHQVVVCSIRKMCSSKQEMQPKLKPKEKLKIAVKEYGSTVIVFHVFISLLSLGGCYIFVSSGIDIEAALHYLKFEDATVQKICASKASTFVPAYAIHKLFAPVRIAMTLTISPFIVKYLRHVGFLKGNISSTSINKSSKKYNVVLFFLTVCSKEFDLV